VIYKSSELIFNSFGDSYKRRYQSSRAGIHLMQPAWILQKSAPTISSFFSPSYTISKHRSYQINKEAGFAGQFSSFQDFEDFWGYNIFRSRPESNLVVGIVEWEIERSEVLLHNHAVAAPV